MRVALLVLLALALTTTAYGLVSTAAQATADNAEELAALPAVTQARCQVWLDGGSEYDAVAKPGDAKATVILRSGGGAAKVEVAQ